MVKITMEHLKYRIIKQILINLMWVAQGLILEMTGVCMHDLREQVNSDYEEISRTLAVQAGGLLVGAIGGGFLHEIFYKHTDLLTSCGLLLMGLPQLTIPWLPSLELLCAAQFFIGAGQGILNTGGNPLVTDLWGEKAAPPLHSLHFGFGVGAMITSQMARPFLSERHIASTFNASTVEPGSSNISVASSRVSRLEYPYSISGVAAIVTSIFMIALYIRGPPKGLYNRRPHKKLRILMSPGSCTGGRVTYGAILLFLGFLFFVLNVGGERVFGSFVFSYAVDAGVAFSKDRAATLTTVFFISHLMGRFLGIFISHWMPIHWFILTDLTLALITWSLGAGLAYNSAAAVWGITAVSGAFISVLFPAGMAWANMYMQPNSMAVMLFLMGTACGNFAYQYIPGYLFSLYGVRCFMYILLQNAVCILVLFIAMQLVARTQGTRFSRATPDINSEEDQTDETSRMDGGIKPAGQNAHGEDEIVAIPLNRDISENVVT